MFGQKEILPITTFQAIEKKPNFSHFQNKHLEKSISIYLWDRHTLRANARERERERERVRAEIDTNKLVTSVASTIPNSFELNLIKHSQVICAL